jgi:group II intron reverse transcriptase/maturase
VQAALLQILEPIFEAGFWTVSYGFRPKRSCRDALEHIRVACKPYRDRKTKRWREAPYQWAIEGDIKGCFDNIDHHALMNRLRRRVDDRRVTRLIVAFLKAGILAEDAFMRTESGTPQGGILSPLLANIMLSAIEERYARWAASDNAKPMPGLRARQARVYDRSKGKPVFMPIRYADDFVVLVSGTQEDACAEKDRLGAFLQEELGLELSVEKTHVTSLSKGILFLGHRFRMRKHVITGAWPRLEIPRERVLDLQHRIKHITKGRNNRPLRELLRELNATLRGWGYFYRHCTGIKRILASVDWYVGHRVWRWLCKKYATKSWRQLTARFQRRLPRSKQKRFAEEDTLQFLLSRIPTGRHNLSQMGHPDFALITGEPDA